MPLAIYQGKYAQLNNKYGWMPASNLILTFDDISNVPVTNAMSVNEWNTFFDLPTYGTPFTSVSVEGNEVTLKGGKNITLRGGLFANSICETSLIHLKDMGCIVDMICINEPENYLTITPFVYIIPPEDSKICRNLESASFTSLLSIGNSAFTSCIILTSITLSNSVTSIENEAFHYCFSLSAVTLGNNVTSIGNSAFASCESLTSITLPNSVTSIGNSAFAACKVLTSIIIPDDVTTIGSYTFAWCQALTSIVMPNNIISIGNNAFEGCTALTSITIPINVTSIGTDAFANCSSLNTVNMYPAIAPTVNADNTFGDYAATLHISYDASGYDVAPWTNAAKFVQIIPDLMQLTLTFDNISNAPVADATSISNWNTFFDLPTYGTPFTSVLVNGNEVTLRGGKDIKLKDYLFGTSTCCKNIIEIKDTGCVTELGEGVFSWYENEENEGCSNLITALFPHVHTINPWVFYYCISLRNVNLSSLSIDSFESAHNAFNYCYNLDDISKCIPAGITYIPNYMFYYTAIESFTIPHSVISIGANPLGSCYNLSEIGVSPTHEYFSSIDGVLFNKNQTTLYIYLSEKPDKLYVIPNSVTNIEIDAFDYAFELFTVHIPNSITTIKDYVFYYCSGLYSIVNNSIIEIGGFAFQSCGFISITLPSTVVTIGEGAFFECYLLYFVNMYSVIAPTVNADTTFGDTAATLHIPYNASGYDVAPWTNTNKFAQIIPDLMQIILTFDNIANVPVNDVYSISNWNTFFDLPAYGTPFTSVLVNGNEVTLRGGKDITLRGGLFADSTCATSLIHFKDTGCVIDMVCLDDMENGIEISPFAHFSMPEAIMNFCRNLESASFTSLLSIRDVAFIGCESLALIDIPFAVTSIGNAAFADCPSLNTINMYPPIAPTVAADSFDDNPTAVLHTPPITSGYDIEPWTNTAKFSTILTDVYGDIII